jgi:4-amino-4-deoxy-L-arabinose transferase-like glycosyltransferase
MRPNLTLLAMAGFAVVALAGVLARPLLPIDETRYLAVAWEMRASGDWLVPHLNGALYTHKPPLLFWLVNLLWSVTGVSETAARIIAPAFGVAAIGLTSLLARRLWPDDLGVGGRAALTLAGTGAFALFSGLTMFDAMLTFAVVLGVLALVATATSPRAWLLFGVALALGGLSKGPVILVHLAPLALLSPLWNGTPPAAMLRGVGTALAVGLGIVGLWLVPAVIFGGPEYRTAVLWSQHAGRVTDSFAHVRPWWFFVAVLPLLLWPWAWSRDIWRRIIALDRHDRGLRLVAIWAVSTVLLFSLISGKQAHYLLPVLPAAALVVARALGREPVRAPFAGMLPALLGLALIAGAVGLVPDERTARLAQPAPAIAFVGLLLLGLGVAAYWLRGAGIALLGLALPPLGALVFALGTAGESYDAGTIGERFAAATGAGVIASSYQGEFHFAGRLTDPVAQFRDLDEAQNWLEAAPGRVLLARLDRDRPDWAPEAMLSWRNRPYGLWTAGAPALKPATKPALEPETAS